jgi:hypothetical protein
VYDFPVLVRLSAGNFAFAQAKANGADLRFTKSDNTFLPYEIERWDASQALAEIWVKIDTIAGNNTTQHITMYWGNPAATAASSSAAAFDSGASGGFQGVWHMAQPGGTTAYDATANRYNGRPYRMTAASAVNGTIGIAQEFDGVSNYIQLTGTANSKLDLPEDGFYTLSAWACVDTIVRGVGGVFLSKGDWQYNLEVDRDENRWHMSEYQDRSGLERIGVPASSHVWTYVVGVRRGTSMVLYVNGVFATSTVSLDIWPYPRNTTFDVSIGKIANESTRFMNGKLDELRIQNVACSADWILLSYLNQRANGALVVFE